MAKKKQIFLPDPTFVGVWDTTDPRIPDASVPGYQQLDRYKSAQNSDLVARLMSQSGQEEMIELFGRVVLSEQPNGGGYKILVGNNRSVAMRKNNIAAGNKPVTVAVSRPTPDGKEVVSFKVLKDYTKMPVKIYTGLDAEQEAEIARRANSGIEKIKLADFWAKCRDFCRSRPDTSELAWSTHVGGLDGFQRYFPGAKPGKKSSDARPTNNPEGHVQTPLRVCARQPWYCADAAVLAAAGEEGGVTQDKKASTALAEAWASDLAKLDGDLRPDMTETEMELLFTAKGVESDFLPLWQTQKLKSRGGRPKGAGTLSQKESAEVSKFFGIVPEARGLVNYIRQDPGFNSDELPKALLEHLKAADDCYKKNDPKGYDRTHGRFVAIINATKENLKREANGDADATIVDGDSDDE